MGKLKKRKQKPQPPKWLWEHIDGCWFCKNRSNCSNCKVMKSYVAEQKKKIERKEKNNFDFL